jgi:hypothetical protein
MPCAFEMSLKHFVALSTIFMTVTLSYSDTAPLNSVMIWCTTVATELVLDELEECSDPCFLVFLLWYILLDGIPDVFLLCLRCLWLLVLIVLTQCSSVGTSGEAKLEYNSSQRVPWEDAVLFSFAVLLLRGCIPDISLWVWEELITYFCIMDTNFVENDASNNSSSPRKFLYLVVN